MTRNEILEEIYAAREALLAEHGGDVHAYVKAARKRALNPDAQLPRHSNEQNDAPKRRSRANRMLKINPRRSVIVERSVARSLAGNCSKM